MYAKNVIGLTVVAGLAFGGGLFVNAVGSASHASMQDPAMQEMDEAMAAMMQAGEPGEHHEALNVLVGKFEGQVKLWMAPDAPPMEAPADLDREWILDGRFLQESISSVTPEGEFHALSFLGYNNLDGQYQTVWMENMSTAMVSDTGVYDPDSETFFFFGNHRHPMGHMQMTYSQLDVSDADRHVMTGWTVGPDGRRYKSFEGVFERTN